ncbi:hypothetical protein EF917_06860 [Streptomyces sp. WAC00469]|nr:hypothetical protein EF917_06860 [Streptomyces sp. WAC00469]
MGIDHGVANLERHVTGTPSVAIQGNTDTPSSEWRFRRSEHISGLDNSARGMLRPPSVPRPPTGIRRSEGFFRHDATRASHASGHPPDRRYVLIHPPPRA